jgi:hypothetical protein
MTSIIYSRVDALMGAMMTKLFFVALKPCLLKEKAQLNLLFPIGLANTIPQTKSKIRARQRKCRVAMGWPGAKTSQWDQPTHYHKTNSAGLLAASCFQNTELNMALPISHRI